MQVRLLAEAFVQGVQGDAFCVSTMPRKSEGPVSMEVERDIAQAKILERETTRGQRR